MYIRPFDTVHFSWNHRNDLVRMSLYRKVKCIGSFANFIFTNDIKRWKKAIRNDNYAIESHLVDNDSVQNNF